MKLPGAYLGCALLAGWGAFGCQPRSTSHDQDTPVHAPPAAPGTRRDFAPPDDSGWGEVAGLRFLEILAGKGQAEDHLPLIIVIHGMGDRPTRDKAPTLDFPARIVLPRAPESYLQGFSWFAYRFDGNDPERLAGEIRAMADRLAAATDLLRRHRPTRGKPVLVGFSQGGMLTYAIAFHHPEVISFAIPIAGSLPKPLWPKHLAPGARPVRGLHGDADAIVPVEAARELVANAKTLGFDVRLKTYPGVQHEIPDTMAIQIGQYLHEAVQRPER